MISRKKCIKNLNELIEVIDKETNDLCEGFYVDHPQQDMWSDETTKEFKNLIGPCKEIRENLGNLINYFSDE